MTPPFALSTRSMRARQARMRQTLARAGGRALGAVALVLGGLAGYLIWAGQTNLGFLCAAVALLFGMLGAWYQYGLRELAPILPATRLDDLLDADLLARLKNQPALPLIWKHMQKDWRTTFVCHHALIDPATIGDALEDSPAALEDFWRKALELHATVGAKTLHQGLLAASLLLTTPHVQPRLIARKLDEADIKEIVRWLERIIASMNRPKQYFGGIGRDWSSGFMPTLEHFGQNISAYVQAAASPPFIVHAALLDSIVHNLSQDMGVALVGETGTGKSTLVDALAARLWQGKDPALAYHQIISLNAGSIISAANGQIEGLMLRLFREAMVAGNCILFLDDAHLFFGSGVGAFDLGQLLQPAMQNRRLKIIAAFTPDDWQALRLQSPALAASFATINVSEPSPDDTRMVIEDAADLLELRNGALVSFEAIREAQRLAGQYMQEDAFPGKAVQLLEQSLSYASGGLVVAPTVQAALETMRGVRVAATNAPEADVLLNLEDHIHERMINQKHAVGVVASALRRGRAGVSNPNRPVGSFLFLGPTGVGKTELARSLAAVYFGSEQQMVRLDMSEYQNPDDAHRLLATGTNGTRSLLLAIRQQPFSVVLLDEIEKAHPNILNLLLQMLDEGQLTDENGKPASFRSAIIIATSNAGAVDIAEQVKTAGNLDNFEQPLIDKLIRGGQFKPELVNRFDEVVLFRPLNEGELKQIAQLMLEGVNKTLEPQRIRVELTDAALAQIARDGYQPEFGARPMRHIIQKTVENAIAVKILKGEAGPGSVITLDIADLQQSTQD